MDQTEALAIVSGFLDLVRGAGFEIEAAYLFGSVARNRADENSDIDVAIILGGLTNTLDAQIELMRLRRKIDLRIEPHPLVAGS